MENTIIERIHFDSSFIFSQEINTNNHPKDPNDSEIANLDYYEELDKTNLINYAKIINYPIEWSYTFSENEIAILQNCAQTCVKTNSTRLCIDELEPLITRLENNWRQGFWFFRFNSVSPKDGSPEYPIWDAKQAISKIVTSNRATRSLSKLENTIYFTIYDNEWDTKREFRVFIYKRKVTAISQYNPYSKSILSGKSNNIINESAIKIKTFLEMEILPKVCEKVGTNNLTCDVYINPDSSIKIVEFNSFGYWQAAGSGLFHWLKDKDKLYNTEDKTYIRIIK